jgi:nucleoside phosphorylase
MGNSSFRTDVAIITAIPEETLLVISKLFTHCTTFLDGGITYLRGCYKNTNEKVYSIVLAYGNEYGGVTSGKLTEKVLVEWNPRFVILLGITMGFREKTELSKVISANSIIDVSMSKISATGVNENIKVYSLDEGFFSDTNFWNSFCIEENIIVGSVISTNAVLASTEKTRELGQKYKDAVGLEMEASGIISSIKSHLGDEIHPHFIFLKGVSDFGEDNKADDSNRETATNNAIKKLESLLLKEVIGPPIQGQKCLPITARKACRAEELQKIGELNFRVGKFDIAKGKFLESWSLSREVRNGRKREHLQVHLSYRLSELYRLLGDFKEAYKFVRLNSIFCLKETNTDFSIGYSYIQLGLIFREIGLRVLALRTFKKAIGIFVENKNPFELARAKMWYGYTQFNLGNHRQAYSTVHEILQEFIEKWAQDSPKSVLVSKCYDLLAIIIREVIYFSNSDNNPKAEFEESIKDFPISIEECKNLLLLYTENSISRARISGDHFRYAEALLTDLISEFEIGFSWRSADYDATFSEGMKLCEENHYRLLSSFFYKYKGLLDIKNSKLNSGFTFLTKRYISSINSRPSEDWGASEEILEQIVLLNDPQKREMQKNIKENLRTLLPDHKEDMLFRIIDNI